MAVEEHARDFVGRRADGRDQHRQRVVLVILHLDVAGFEPPLDESCGRNQLLSTGGVVGDQALSQYALVYHREELTVRRLAAPPACRESTVPPGASGGSHFEERLPTALVPLSDPSPLGVVAGVLELALGLLEAVAQRSGIELGLLMSLLGPQ